MNRETLSSSSGKPCSCRQGIPCVGCKNKRVIKPIVQLEEPRRLPVPIVISYYKQKKPVTVNRATEEQRFYWKKREGCIKRGAICKWFRKRKALKDLKTEHAKEKQRAQWDPLYRSQKEEEYEYFKELQKQQAEQYAQDKDRRLVIAPRRSKEKVIKEKIVKPKKEKISKEKIHKAKKESVIEPSRDSDTTTTTTRSKSMSKREESKYLGKAAHCKPCATSKYAYVKTYNHQKTYSERFVNCFYRFCCQLYCCFTLVVIIGLAVILLV